jgi:hypothetical protein
MLLDVRLQDLGQGENSSFCHLEVRQPLIIVILLKEKPGEPRCGPGFNPISQVFSKNGKH